MRIFAVALMLVVLVIGNGCNSSPQHYVEVGNRFFAVHNYDEASIAYRKALQKDPNFGDAAYGLGLIALERNGFKDAHPFLQRAVDLLPQSDDAKAKLADTSLALYASTPGHPRGYYEQATKMSDQLLAKDPNSFDGLRIRGLLRMLDSKPHDAVEWLQMANKVKPMQHDAVLTLTQALFADNQFEDGQRLALEMIKKEPSFEPIYDALYRQYRAMDRVADAENILKLKVEKNPGNANNYIQLAEHYARAQKPADMTATLGRVLADPKRFPDGRLKVGDFYAKIGNWPEAVHQFEAGVQAEPKQEAKVAYQKRIVDGLLAQGKRVEAEQVIDAIVKQNPKDTQARRVQANLRIERGTPADLDAGLTELASLVKESPNDPVLRFDRGRALLLKNLPDPAMGEFQQALRAQRDYLPAVRALAVTNLQQRRPSEALKYVQLLIGYQPDSAGATLLAVQTLTALGRYNDARSELGLLLRRYPDNYNVQLQRGLLALAEKKYKDAESILQKLDQASPGDVRAAAALAEMYAGRDQFEEALRLLETDLKRNPDSPTLRGLVAFTATRAGKYDQAIATYRDLLAKEPKSKSAELLIRLSMVYQMKGDDQNAIATLEQARTLAPQLPAAAVLMGISQGRIGRSEEAKASYRQALQLQPENVTALNNLAYLLVTSGGNLDEAQKLVERALKQVPGQPNYTDTLGCIYLRKKMNDSAVQTFDNLVRQQPQNATYHYHLGWALLEKGDKTKGRKELENALANRPSADEAAKIRELISKAG